MSRVVVFECKLDRLIVDIHDVLKQVAAHFLRERLQGQPLRRSGAFINDQFRFHGVNDTVNIPERSGCAHYTND